MAQSTLIFRTSAGGSATGLALLVFLVASLPLLLTPAIPAVDFNSHLLRYVILADDGATPFLARNYSPDWKLVTNLGLDPIGILALKIVPPLVAGKLIAVMLLAVIYGGTLFLAQAVQGQLRPMTVVLAGFLMHSHVFVWGFSNFLFGLGIALFGLAAWIRTSGTPRLQLALGLLFGVGLMLAHALAFGLWGVMLGAFELGRAIDGRDLSLRSLLGRALRLASLAVIPAFLFLASSTADAPEGATAALVHLKTYADSGRLIERLATEVVHRIDLLFRVADSRAPWADRLVGLALWALVAGGLLTGALRLEASLRSPVAFAAALVAVMPPNLFGSGYVNDRLPLLLLALVVAGLTANEAHRHARSLLLSAVALLALHLGLVSVQHWRAGRYFDEFALAVAALDTGETAGYLKFAKSGRDELSPLCSPSLILLTLVNQTAVPTFAFPGMQPLQLDGRLKAAMSRIAKTQTSATLAIDRDNPTPEWRSARIAGFLEAGFDSVFVCDGDGPLPASKGFRAVAQGDGWAIYRPIDGARAIPAR